MMPRKLVSFILQALLVITAVVVFAFFDPFGIFNSKKLNMKDTPTIVNSIKGIGQLITAEYYGEVIKSSTEEAQENIETLKALETDGLYEMEDRIKDALSKIHEGDKDAKLSNKRKLYRLFKKEYEDVLMTDSLYNTYIDIMHSSTKQNEKDLLWKYFQNNDSDSIRRAFINRYLNDKYKVSRAEQRRIVKNSLALLGRGWVKAGIDLSNFDESHFRYYPDRNLVRLIHHQPEIISLTINPWFIPEKKIKGFEYLFVGRSLDKNPDSEKSLQTIQNLKAQCLDNLRNDAIESGILQRAKEQAEASLSHLLSLLLEKEITVEIYKHPLEAVLYDLLKQQKITARNVIMIDSVVNKFVAKDSIRTFDFLRELYDSLGTNHSLNKPWKGADAHLGLMAFYDGIADDGFYSKRERDSVDHFNYQKLEAKDFLYVSLKDSLVLSSLKTSHFRASKPDSAIKAASFNIKKTNFDSLKSKLNTLKSSLR